MNTHASFLFYANLSFSSTPAPAPSWFSSHTPSIPAVQKCISSSIRGPGRRLSFIISCRLVLVRARLSVCRPFVRPLPRHPVSSAYMYTYALALTRHVWSALCLLWSPFPEFPTVAVLTYLLTVAPSRRSSVCRCLPGRSTPDLDEVRVSSTRPDFGMNVEQFDEVMMRSLFCKCER